MAMADTTDIADTTTPPLRPGRGEQRRVTDPAGHRHVLQAARSGHVDWPVYGAQTALGLLVQSVGTAVVHRLIFRGDWRVTAWRGDAIAPKRTRVSTSRYRTEAAAVEALDILAAEIAHQQHRPDER
jgi:hypothetical protein